MTIELENFKRARELGEKLGIFIDIRKEPQSIILDILEVLVDKILSNKCPREEWIWPGDWPGDR